jgi:hypothetical protein
VRLFRKRITEQDAAAAFVLNMASKSRSLWPIIKNSFNIMNNELPLMNNEMAIFNLFLAGIVLELQVLSNIYPRQSERVVRLVIKIIDSDSVGEYAVDEMANYNEAYYNSIDNKENPVDSISTILLHRWFGNNLANFCIEIDNKKTDIISPVLIMLATTKIVLLLGFWKGISINYKLIKSELPS